MILSAFLNVVLLSRILRIDKDNKHFNNFVVFYKLYSGQFTPPLMNGSPYFGYPATRSFWC